MKCNQFSSLVGMDLGEFQTTVTHLASQQPSSDSETDEEPHMQADTYQVHCRLCSTYLCELSDIRRYMKSYHLVLNPNIHEKVDLKSLHNSFMKFFDCKYCEGFLVRYFFQLYPNSHRLLTHLVRSYFVVLYLAANSSCTFLSCNILVYESHSLLCLFVFWFCLWLESVTVSLCFF